MPFSQFDTPSVARSLSQIADRQGDLADVFFERTEVVELPPEDEVPGFRVRREEGLAVRLVRDGLSWLAVRDSINPQRFAEALRQVARAMPRASYAEPRLTTAAHTAPPAAPEVRAFPADLARAIRERHVAFPYRARLRRYRRQVQVVGTRLVCEPQEESYYSLTVDLPWGGYGVLLPQLDASAERVAEELVARFAAREAAPPERSGAAVLVLGPAAAAVLLHEAVAHALETDTLVLGGQPEAAAGLQLGSEWLSVLDDPAAAPGPVRRDFDDEGMPVVRRWLLKDGAVSQPLADLFAARASEALLPGAGRRSSRSFPPVPRSHHLELVAGEQPLEELLTDADGGLYLPAADRGRLDPLSGELELSLPFGHRIRSGRPAEAVGRCRLRGRVAEVLSAVAAVGRDSSVAGAGWCAKGGQALPVWASAAALRFEGLGIEP